VLKEVFTPIPVTKKSLTLNLSVALLYITSGLLGQMFAIPPGNITPIGLPSGLMFALALKHGPRIWPGVFFGAFFGNIWAYFSLDNITVSINAICAATLNGFGDVCAVVGMVLVLCKILKNTSPFISLFNFAVFVAIGGVLGAFISAVVGVTGLVLFGFIEATDYLVALTNWWIGDAVGVLLLAPFLHSFISNKNPKVRFYAFYLLFSLFVFSVLSAEVFEFVSLNANLFKMLIVATPLAFAAMVSSGQQVVYSVQLVVVSIAVVATYQGLGPFATYHIVSPLVELQTFIAVFSLMVFSLALIVEQKRLMLIKLTEQKKELETLYTHDKLTGLYNRYRIEEHLKAELERFKRNKTGFSVLILDIDNFKSVNDNFGHLEGDRILIELSELLNTHTRSIDLVGRWGGEEFIIFTEECEKNHVSDLANKLLSVIRSYDFKIGRTMTVSIGYTISIENDTPLSIVQRADEALYYAKRHGKNQAHFT